jgi:hypothetical protein
MQIPEQAPEISPKPVQINQQVKRQRDRKAADFAMFQFVAGLMILTAFVCSFFVVINAGERGVLMQFGQVQPQVLEEGIHPIIPIAQTVKKMSVLSKSRKLLPRHHLRICKKSLPMWHLIGILPQTMPI